MSKEYKEYEGACDEEYDDWKIGDVVTWQLVEEGEEKEFVIEHIAQGYVWWKRGNGEETATRETNLVRLRKA